MVSPGRASLTLASCTDKHDANLAYLMSLGKLLKVKGAESLGAFTIKSTLLALLTARRSFALMCCANGIDYGWIAQTWLL